MEDKPKVGIYGITGCYGCLLSFIYNEDELLKLIDIIDLKAFPFIKEKREEKKFDIVFLEGTVVNKEDLKIVKQLREKTTYLVAVGACSCNGGVPSLKYFTSAEKFKCLVYHKASKIKEICAVPVDTYVKVDFYLPGCPPDKEDILSFIKKFVKGMLPLPYTEPVCYECKLNNNACLLDFGKLCLGPITRGNCKAVCPTHGLECWGCRGPTDDANLDVMIHLLETKGFDLKHIKERMETFVGLKIAEMEKGHKKWLE